MTGTDRRGRAEDYVLGLMDETERARAERDMAVDPEFRDCVLELAHKLQRLHDAKQPGKSADEAWNEIAARIAALPQMAGMPDVDPKPSAAKPRITKPRIEPRRPAGGRSALVVALGMAAVFAIGYLVGYLR